MLSRRQFVVGVGVSAGALLAGCGSIPFQSPPPTAVKVHRVGWLHGGSSATNGQLLALFRQALSELGYVERQNLVLEERWGEGSDARLAEPALELVRRPVDVIVVPSGQVAQIVRDVTTTLPIVMAGTRDPVAYGLAASYARPGCNVTGVTSGGAELAGKRLQLLKEAAPSISRVAIFWDAAALGLFPAANWGRDAQAVGVQLHPMLLQGPEDIDAAFEAAAQAPADALMLVPSPLASTHRTRIIELTARLRWPAMYYQRLYVDQGGLMAYEASLSETWQRAAVYVDKVLRGSNPADLPIEQPMHFDFTVNLTTAEALGLTFPEATRLQVTEVIR